MAIRTKANFLKKIAIMVSQIMAKKKNRATATATANRDQHRETNREGHRRDY